MDQKDTIAAIATPPGRGGVGIIRLSGPSSLEILNRVFHPINSAATLSSSPRTLVLGHILHKNDTILDQALCVFMPSPHSYTGEDVCEIQGHGGSVVLRAILQRVLSQGARLAQPGEFTRRAFLNGRIDLTQAEAVLDIIQARSQLSFEAASRLLSGGLGEKVRSITDSLTNALAQIEASLDFEEDVNQDLITGLSEYVHKNIVLPLQRLHFLSEQSNLIRKGLQISLVGKTNVGKSTLLNALLGKDRSIITPHPGTTRDSLHEPWAIDGVNLVLVDTAGIRKSKDEVEQIGVQKTMEELAKSHLILLVIDAAQNTEDWNEILSAIGKLPVIVVANKSDLLSTSSNYNPPKALQQFPYTLISAKMKLGLKKLEQSISQFVSQSTLSLGEGEVLPNLRHSQSFSLCLKKTLSAQEQLQHGFPELAATDFHDAVQILAQITGKNASPDILDAVFSQFCIGK